MKISKKIRILFVIRLILWTIAAVATGYWMWYSEKLHADGIFEPSEYAPLFRPVFYTGLIVAFVALCISFGLYALSQKLKRKMRRMMPTDDDEKKDENK